MKLVERPKLGGPSSGGQNRPGRVPTGDDVWKSWVRYQVRPLWTLTGATAWLRQSPEEVMRWIENGRLEWAWNIAICPQGRCREIRIWFPSLEVCKAGQCLPVLALAQVVQAVIGHHRPNLRGYEVQNILNCDRNLLARHVAAGGLRRVGVERWPRSPLLSRESLANFLLSRRIR